MKLTDDEVRYVAGLANLRLTNAEVERMSHDLGQILTHIDQLSTLNTTDVEPMAQVLYEADETATLREDVPHTPLGSSVATGNAPVSGASYFKVPRVIER